MAFVFRDRRYECAEASQRGVSRETKVYVLRHVHRGCNLCTMEGLGGILKEVRLCVGWVLDALTCDRCPITTQAQHARSTLVQCPQPTEGIIGPSRCQWNRPILVDNAHAALTKNNNLPWPINYSRSWGSPWVMHSSECLGP